MLSAPTTFLLILLPKVVLARGLVTELGISLSGVVMLEGVSISEAGVRIVNKFLLRASLKTLPIWISVINSSDISPAGGVAVYSSLIICWRGFVNPFLTFSTLILLIAFLTFGYYPDASLPANLLVVI